MSKLLLGKLLTPAGVLAMAVSLWLPWADVHCSQIQTSPTYWDLAGYDHRMYWLAVFVGIVAIAATLHLVNRCRIAATCAAFGAVAAVAAWCYLWLKRDQLAAYQTQMATQQGDLARLLQDMQVSTGSGFKLYLAGALFALLGTLLSWSAPKRSGSAPSAEG
jgi:hypothetical protein